MPPTETHHLSGGDPQDPPWLPAPDRIAHLPTPSPETDDDEDDDDEKDRGSGGGNIDPDDDDSVPSDDDDEDDDTLYTSHTQRDRALRRPPLA